MKATCNAYQVGTRGYRPVSKVNLAVHFDSGRSDIKPTAAAALDELVSTLKDPSLGNCCFRVEGHTDADGSPEYNLALSERRAESVRSYLKEKGVDSERLLTVAYGEEDPIETNETRPGEAGQPPGRDLQPRLPQVIEARNPPRHRGPGCAPRGRGGHTFSWALRGGATGPDRPRALAFSRRRPRVWGLRGGALRSPSPIDWRPSSMERLRPVFWGQGMFLQPEHFQQQDQYHEARLTQYVQMMSPFAWGFAGSSSPRSPSRRSPSRSTSSSW